MQQLIVQLLNGNKAILHKVSIFVSYSIHDRTVFNGAMLWYETPELLLNTIIKVALLLAYPVAIVSECGTSSKYQILLALKTVMTITLFYDILKNKHCEFSPNDYNVLS